MNGPTFAFEVKKIASRRQALKVDQIARLIQFPSHGGPAVGLQDAKTNGHGHTHGTLNHNLLLGWVGKDLGNCWRRETQLGSRIKLWVIKLPDLVDQGPIAQGWRVAGTQIYLAQGADF